MTSHAEANPLHRAMRRLAATRPMSWFYARTLHHVDRFTFRVTRGRTTFAAVASGLPVVMLTTTGARSGQERTLPVLGLPDGDRMVVIASNYGQRHHPGWYHNLRAHPEASIVVDGARRRVRSHEATGDERARLWEQALGVYPGWTTYRERASHRTIPVMVLSPAPDGADAE